MKLTDLKKEIEKYQYFEDTDIIDISLASIVATRLKLGDPIWLVIIGPSSGGKSQILRPLSLTDSKFLHRVDDLTENTFLSGANVSEGKDASLLTRIGAKGMLVMSDLTVLFSKNKESRAAILSQFRMLYDGEMIKFVGNKDKPITWKGYLGIIAGSTPSIYGHFEEVADMGERFIYYRMKDYDAEKATRLSMKRTMYGKELDDTLSGLYADYIKDVVSSASSEAIVLSDIVQERIIKIAMFAERVRTSAHTDIRDKTIDRIPVPAMPMRVALQLTAIAKGLSLIRQHETGNSELNDNDLHIIDWCGYSLANEEKRACLRVLASIEYNVTVQTQTIADTIGLNTSVTGVILQNLASVGVITRSGGEGGLHWKITKEEDWKIVRRIEDLKGLRMFGQRVLSIEEDKEKDQMLDDILSKI